MAQFSNVTYGSRFPTGGLRGNTGSGPIPMGANNPYGGYAGANGNLASLLSGMGGQQGYFSLNPYQSGVAPGTGAAPSAQAQQQVGAGGGFHPPTPNDLSTDPILQQIQAAGQRRVQDARSAALANSENALIGYGSVNVPDSLRSAYGADQTNPILAALTDAATQRAAQANPDSTLARLGNQNVQNEARLNQGENAANLFYSSDRGNQLGNLANNYRSAQNDAAANLAGLLGQANQSVLDAQQQASGEYQSGLGGAWDRWLALQNLGGYPSGGGSTAPPPPTQVITPSSPDYGTYPTTYVPSTTAKGRVKTISGYGF